MIDTKKWNKDFIGEKVLKPMYEDGKFPLELADQIKLAIDKQIPKKPLNVDTDENTFECPSCMHTIIALDDLSAHKHCLICGQALDWSK